MTNHHADIQMMAPNDPVERRLIRFALDLHDGPLQEVAALLGDLRLFRAQLEEILPLNGYRDRILGRFDDLESRLLGLDGDLRGLAQHSHSTPFLPLPFHEMMQDQIDELAAELRLKVSLSLEGELELLSGSQRIALLRVVHQALTNVGKHGGGAEADVLVEVEADGTVRAEIWDGGSGFDVERALVRAAREGRLGLVGMAERVRLLGGTLEIDSTPGGPTQVSLSLPGWRGGERVEPPTSGRA